MKHMIEEEFWLNKGGEEAGSQMDKDKKFFWGRRGKW